MNEFFKTGFNSLISILVTISLGLGSFGLLQVFHLKSDVSVLQSETKSIKDSVDKTNTSIENYYKENDKDREKLAILAEKINNIDKNLIDIKADLKEAIKNK